MNGTKAFIAGILFLIALSARAEIKNIDDVMAKATSNETQDLGKLLRQIQLAPTKELQEGMQVMKVMRVEKGSAWDRLGIKVGDLVAARRLKQSGETMELKSQIKKNTHSEGTSN